MPGPAAIFPAEFPKPVLQGRRSRAASAVQETAADPKLKGACEEMEALFLHHLLSEMRKTVSKSGLIDGGRAEEIYTSLMDAELAQQMARDGGLGLSSLLLEQMRDRSGFNSLDHACGQGPGRPGSGAASIGCEHVERPAIPPSAGPPGVGRGYGTTSKVPAGSRR